MVKRLYLFLCIIFTFQGIGFSQDYFRIAADFTVKISNSNGTKSLTRGSCYYDKNIKDLIYNVTFPKSEKWISKDTSLYVFENDKLIKRTTIPSINEFTVFHLALNSGLNDYGLKNTVYRINKVEKKSDLVLSYWKIPKQVGSMIDHVVIAKKNNRLESVVMVGENQKVLSKQFFKNYINIGAIEFPQQIVQILYSDEGKENYQVTEYRNIKVNDISNSELYKYNFITYDK